MAWAEGRSYEQRMEITNRSEQHEHCGTLRNTYCSPNRLGKRPKRKLGPANVRLPQVSNKSN